MMTKSEATKNSSDGGEKDISEEVCDVEVQIVSGQTTRVMSGKGKESDDKANLLRSNTGSALDDSPTPVTKVDDAKTIENSFSSERTDTDDSVNDTTERKSEELKRKESGNKFEHQETNLRELKSYTTQDFVQIFSTKRRPILCIGAVFIIVIAVIVGTGVPKSDDDKAPPSNYDHDDEIQSSRPSQEPTSDISLAPYGNLGFILEDYMPLRKDAIKWLTEIDTWAPPENVTNAEQIWVERYALASFYYSTDTMKSPWRSNDQWLSAESTCSWYGVECNAMGEVVEIRMSHNAVMGYIPSQIGALTSLTKMQLDSNQLSGSIPSEIGALTLLSHIDLYFNDLSGSLPNEMGTLTSLTGLYLRGNRLSGSLPESLGEFTSLTELQLSENSLSGSIPSDIAGLTGLVTVILNNNDFSGSLPSQIGALTKLKWLEIDENRIVGSLPEEIGSLTNVITFAVGENKLTGSIPEEIGSLTNMFRLDLRGNRLAGSLPAKIGGHNSLFTLDLSGNQFTGSIPFLPTSLNKKDYKNGPRCSLGSNNFVDVVNGDNRGCDIADQKLT